MVARFRIIGSPTQFLNNLPSQYSLSTIKQRRCLATSNDIGAQKQTNIKLKAM